MPDFDYVKDEDTGLPLRQGRRPVLQNVENAKVDILDVNAMIREGRHKLQHRPFVYFWLIEFNDNTAVAQFDPKTGKENSYGEQVIPRANKIVAARWTPFTQSLMEKIDFPAICLPLPYHRVELNPGDRLTIFRRNTLHYGRGFSRGQTEYFIGIYGQPVKRIFENGKYEMSKDYI
jgi:hypothetical protein